MIQETTAAIHAGHEAAVAAAGGDMTHAMMRLILQLAVILVSAKLCGWLAQRFLKLPSVLGELAAGMLIGPYALGSRIHLPSVGALFSEVNGFAASSELYGIATLASVILLFLAGLETDLAAFLRYSLAGSAVGLGGLLAAFFLGSSIAVLWPGNGIHSLMDPAALFLGVISVATSVGITARILAEKRKMSSPEGVTILAGAVFDDVFGIVTLAVVMGMARARATGSAVNWSAIELIALKATGFFIVITTVGLLSARKVTGAIKQFKSKEIIVTICFGLALLLAGLAEMAGLAMIIGAYIMGLALSRTDLVHEIESYLEGVYNLLVPVFFCVMGMMVDFRAMRPVLLFGTAYSLLAVAAKIVGCGLPAWAMNFNPRGALRIGLGMLPRGEVALIVAGLGLSAGMIDQPIFGVAIMMTVITTLLAPPLLVRSFRGGSGVRKEIRGGSEQVETMDLDFPSSDIAEFLLNRFVRALRNEEFFVHRLHHDTPTYQIRKDNIFFVAVQDGGTLRINVPAEHQQIARLMLAEELLSLSDLMQATRKMDDLQQMGTGLLSGLF